ncbi:exodeoxyribonuclease VII large subunit [Pseudoclavibacter soli]|uniref:exodeoxyribonuclease VII large subunit n=1 Tax=Pseudoclavibacter soli TaxID=452623 RepID=UPI00040AFA5D|nr:exodeoxyribonuclease VII large subunit [Pseudoclavibacter soli]
MSEHAPADGPATADAPWSVARVSQQLKTYIDRLGAIWVEGEITQWNVRGGNVFGKLKDLEQDATFSFAIWSSTARRIDLAEFSAGDRVIGLFAPNYWPKGGSLTFVTQALRHAGLGDLLERLERLRRQLAEEGLFDAARKHPLPFLPGLIGLITGANSDAEKDVLRNAALRWPAVRFRTIHTAVQGEHVPEQVVAAIETLDADPEVEVIIIARGGGDFQHLLGFSDERLLRAAAAATTPIVSAIGHENDRPLLDEVADLRASTPTDAAKRVVPDVSDELLRTAQARTRLLTAVTGLVRIETDRLTQLRSRPVLRAPEWIIQQRAEQTNRDRDRATELFSRLVEREGSRISALRGQLVALSPQATLQRGYAIARDEAGHVLTDASRASTGDHVSVLLAAGSIAATVNATSDHTLEKK